MSILKALLLAAALVGVSVGMLRSEDSVRPVEQNYDGYGPRPTYGREVYADSSTTKRDQTKADIRDIRVGCLRMKSLQEKFHCMEAADD